MKDVVSLVDCADYESERVYGAVKQALEPMGGMRAFVRTGQRALLQVNLISARPPEDAVCTHPSLVAAVCRLVCEAGGVPAVGGSAGGSGYHRTRAVLRVSGIAQAAQDQQAAVLNYDETGGEDVVGGGLAMGTVHLGKPVLEADVLITLPKMKTHTLTLFTGAVKNHLGTLPGGRKSELHRRFPEHERFGEALTDIYAAAPPHLAIMDAIQGMDGDGPTAGQVRQVGLVAASRDGVALDAVMCAVGGIDPRWVPTFAAARRLGVGAASLDEIEVAGVPLEDARRRTRPFTYPMPYRLLAHSWVPERVWDFAGRHIAGSPAPFVLTDKCNGCQTCAQSCPAKAVAVVDKKAHIDQKKCISCFTCHELCLQQAIGIKIPRIWQLFRV